MRRLCFVLGAVCLTACGDDGPAADDSGSTTAATTGTTGPGSSSTSGGESTAGSSGGEASSTGDDESGDSTTTGSQGCPDALPPANRVRQVIVALPFDEAGGQARRYGRLELDEDGNLSEVVQEFEMGRAFEGPIVFTPDGRFGVVPQTPVVDSNDSASLGVFRVADDGVVDVLDPGFVGDFYPSKITMAADGRTVWVIDSAFEDAGGGVYEVELDCDGTLIDHGRVLPGRLVSGLLFTPQGNAILSAIQMPGVTPGPQGFLFAWPGEDAPLSTADMLGHTDAVVEATALTPDGGLFAIADNSTFAPVSNQVGFVQIDGETLVGAGAIEVFNPYELVASPFDDVLLVASGESNTIYVLDYTPGGTPALSMRGPLEAADGQPVSLPGKATMVRRGDLEGLVLWAQDGGIRRIQLGGDGQVTDLGVHSPGSGLAWIVGGIGVQP